jgi:hypothetical protein
MAKVLVAVLFLGLIACTERQPESSEPDETVFDPLTDTLDRARGVEETLLNSEEERRRLIDE